MGSRHHWRTCLRQKKKQTIKRWLVTSQEAEESPKANINTEWSYKLYGGSIGGLSLERESIAKCRMAHVCFEIRSIAYLTKTAETWAFIRVHGGCGVSPKTGRRLQVMKATTITATITTTHSAAYSLTLMPSECNWPHQPGHRSQSTTVFSSTWVSVFRLHGSSTQQG